MVQDNNDIDNAKPIFNYLWWEIVSNATKESILSTYFLALLHNLNVNLFHYVNRKYIHITVKGKPIS